jgi:hypothetical protein
VNKIVKNDHLVETKISSEQVYNGSFLNILRDTVAGKLRVNSLSTQAQLSLSPCWTMAASS